MKGKNPYVGPRAFRQDEVLYGRDCEVRQLLDLSIAERILLMYSPSGAGKTSLLQAALIPALEKEEFHVLPIMRVSLELSNEEKAEAGQSNRYLLSALLSLERTGDESEQLPLPELARMSFVDYLRRSKTEGNARMLIFDQFEEVLTIDPTDQDAKDEFFDQVGTALRDRELWALFSMREDYVAGLDPFLRRIPTRLATTFRLDLLNKDAGRNAIHLPAKNAGIDFREDAANKLLDDLRAVLVQQSDGKMERHLGPHIEPVQLQVVCHRLWDKLPNDANEVTPDDIETIGDVNAALAGYYADKVKEIGEHAERASERSIREWFEHRLITEQGLRGQVLQGLKTSDGLPNTVIKPLVDAHLVRGEKRRGVTWFELAHDRLIEPIQKNNSEWLRDNLNEFQRQAVLWDRQNRPDSLLMYGGGLTEAELWLEKRQPQLTSIEKGFLSRCREARKKALQEKETEAKLAFERSQVRRRGKFVALMTVVSLVAVVALGLLGFNYRKLKTAESRLRIEQQTVQAKSELAESERRRAEESAGLYQQQATQLQYERDNRSVLIDQKVREIVALVRRERRKRREASSLASSGQDSIQTPSGKDDTEELLKNLENRLRDINSVDPGPAQNRTTTPSSTPQRRRATQPSKKGGRQP